MRKNLKKTNKMSFWGIQCNGLFQSADFHNSVISMNVFKEHNTEENPWISFDKRVFSIQKDDIYLLEIFKDYYGKDVKKVIKGFSKEKQQEIFEKLRDRYIGQLSVE